MAGSIAANIAQTEDGIDGERAEKCVEEAGLKEKIEGLSGQYNTLLNPIAEAEIYSKFSEIVKDKTAIYISHRLSSCRFCDDIAVFDKGQIVQQGSHENLVADVGGKYYELWQAQAQYYT